MSLSSFTLYPLPCITVSAVIFRGSERIRSFARLISAVPPSAVCSIAFFISSALVTLVPEPPS